MSTKRKIPTISSSNDINILESVYSKIKERIETLESYIRTLDRLEQTESGQLIAHEEEINFLHTLLPTSFQEGDLVLLKLFNTDNDLIGFTLSTVNKIDYSSNIVYVSGIEETSFEIEDLLPFPSEQAEEFMNKYTNEVIL